MFYYLKNRNPPISKVLIFIYAHFGIENGLRKISSYPNARVDKKKKDVADFAPHPFPQKIGHCAWSQALSSYV